MKIAVPFENGQVFGHFGKCGNFKLYETDGAGVTSTRVAVPDAGGHGALAAFLKEQGVQVLICGGIGGGARLALAEAGIRLYPGVTGEADASVDALLRGDLAFDPDHVCGRHHGADHDCGQDTHGCAGDH